MLVLQAGGFTTSIQAGMAFLDWPLSNGSINPPGWLTEIAKFAEHSHRLAAAGLGLFCIVIAFCHYRYEPRRGVRLAAYTLLGLVILQGGLGALRVQLDKLNLGTEDNMRAVSFAIGHAVNAQLTIALLAIIATSHTQVWRTPREFSAWERHFAQYAALAVLGVIVVGAVMRQNRFTSWVTNGNFSELFLPAGDGFGWAINLMHRSGALLAAASVLAFALSGERRRGRWLPLGLLLVAQVALGILSISLPLNPHVRTVHLVVGAALFATLCAHVALVHKAEAKSA